MPTKDPIFQNICDCTIQGDLSTNTESKKNQRFHIEFLSDGIIPFPQVIIRHHGEENIFHAERVESGENFKYQVTVKEGNFPSGQYHAQIEGCKKKDYHQASGDDWIKTFLDFEIVEKKKKETPTSSGSSKSKQKLGSKRDQKIKIYFGIHKHMHQPYYDAADIDYWDGEKDFIFSSRTGPYTDFIPSAIHHYENGKLSHGGLSTSWSGTLIEQLNRCSQTQRAGGNFSNWQEAQKNALEYKTVQGNSRLCFSAFGYFHPLMPLIPHRDIVRNIEMHRSIIKETFGQDASKVLFPPETAFHVRMIPALNEAGIQAVIYDSVHRARACKNYPYPGKEEGMLPPNQADQENEEVDDWLQLQNVWAPSKIAPSLLKPEYVGYTDPNGKTHKIIAIPAERYIGNEDARGGFGALQYPNVLGQLYDKIVDDQSYDPKHPPFFLLHSDGDNYGGGTDSYYKNNTEQLVQWLNEDPRFELMSAEDYLEMFPPDPDHVVHIEPGSWAGADNGDPQFKKWFGMYDQPYSPDLNSWAVLTALQNLAHSLEDANINTGLSEEITFLMLTAETSCYWYWTGQDQWDFQVTHAANKAWGLAGELIDTIKAHDSNGPSIFAPWITPENPGGLTWGNNCLVEADKTAKVNTFIYDINGIKEVTLTLVYNNKKETFIMKNDGDYPCHSGASHTSTYYTLDLPPSLGHCEYYITATDHKENQSTSALERIYIK